jgi:hypothetical protein
MSLADGIDGNDCNQVGSYTFLVLVETLPDAGLD